ncbi:hypothetical protein JHK82_027496 [Glycine max]|nr:hypothetical protein JHK82_027496 [Glycine max]KAH1137519.1 hypothetical protein GYH30_027498 [Glycine max]
MNFCLLCSNPVAISLICSSLKLVVPKDTYMTEISSCLSSHSMHMCLPLEFFFSTMKHRHRHGHRTRHGYGHVDTCNVQNIERNTGVVSVSDADTDACRTLTRTRAGHRTRQRAEVSVLHSFSMVEVLNDPSAQVFVTTDAIHEVNVSTFDFPDCVVDVAIIEFEEITLCNQEIHELGCGASFQRRNFRDTQAFNQGPSH